MTPYAQRLCPLCTLAPGDERHFVFDCPNLTPVRLLYPALPSLGKPGQGLHGLQAL